MIIALLVFMDSDAVIGLSIRGFDLCRDEDWLWSSTSSASAAALISEVVCDFMLDKEAPRFESGLFFALFCFIINNHFIFMLL